MDLLLEPRPIDRPVKLEIISFYGSSSIFNDNVAEAEGDLSRRRELYATGLICNARKNPEPDKSKSERIYASECTGSNHKTTYAESSLLNLLNDLYPAELISDVRKNPKPVMDKSWQVYAVKSAVSNDKALSAKDALLEELSVIHKDLSFAERIKDRATTSDSREQIKQPELEEIIYTLAKQTLNLPPSLWNVERGKQIYDSVQHLLTIDGKLNKDYSIPPFISTIERVVRNEEFLLLGPVCYALRFLLDESKKNGDIEMKTYAKLGKMLFEAVKKHPKQRDYSWSIAILALDGLINRKEARETLLQLIWAKEIPGDIGDNLEVARLLRWRRGD